MIAEHNPKKLEIEKRRVEVAKLRRDSLSMDEIAIRLGVAKGTVWNDLQAIREGLKAEYKETYQAYREEMLERAEMVMAETLERWRKKGDLKALERYQSMFNQACKLTGIEAPIKIAETDNHGNPIGYDGERGFLDSLLATIAGGNRIAGELGDAAEN